MAHPELLRDDGQAAIRPRYPKLPGLGAERLRTLIGAALERVGGVPDPVPPAVREREQLASAEDGFLGVHRPGQQPDETALHPLRERLAWAESFASGWVRARREQEYRSDALPLPPDAAGLARLEQALGFQWTAAQARTIAETSADLARSEPTRRLISGDVGSGKTAVALAAALQAVTAGAQVAILAPTTPLAEQYRTAAQPLAQATGARIELLTGATPPEERAAIERDTASGEVGVLIGTHVLLSRELDFQRLALVVVDEQQRLGVAQRLALSRRRTGGVAPHLLTLSATPIPRTLALALRGELSTSELDELPPGRKPVTTRAVARHDWDAAVLPAILAALDAGGHVFVVCPRIGDDADDEDAGPAVVDRFKELCAALGRRRVVLAHGRLEPRALAAALRGFRRGDTPVLVGTTVIEVGLDVPEATLMVIDGAESFGLSQLHQLRGRVGRSHRGGSCLLVHDTPLVEPARSRLEALTRLSRGADIARADLELRGPGDAGGTRQSGESGLVYLDAFADAPWLTRIPSDVERLRREDPELARPEHALLRLFVERLPERPEARGEAG
jgi:ATP-dependent DNA helicase RecG